MLPGLPRHVLYEAAIKYAGTMEAWPNFSVETEKRLKCFHVRNLRWFFASLGGRMIAN